MPDEPYDATNSPLAENLWDAVVAPVRYIDVSAGGDGQAPGQVELAVSGPVRAEAREEDAAGRESLDSVVMSIRDIDGAVRADCQTGRPVQI